MTSISQTYDSTSALLSRQAAFLEISRKTIEDLSEQIEKIRFENTPDFIGLFHDLLEQLGSVRRAIAEKADTHCAREFGHLISKTPQFNALFHSTLWGGRYAPAAKESFSQIEKTVEILDEDSPEVFEETIDGRRFSFHAEVISINSFISALPLRDSVTTQINQFSNTLSRFISPIEKTKLFYKENPVDWDLLETSFCCDKIATALRRVKKKTEEQGLANCFFFLTKKTELQNKMVRTSRWLTWLFKDEISSPFKRITELDSQPEMLILHQNPFEKTLSVQECARLFEEILNQPVETIDPEKLKEQIALFRYIFAEAVPYLRGSAAIAEWLEAALYRSFGFSVTYHKNYDHESVDLFAMGSLKYSDYLKRYKEFVQIEASHCLDKLFN